MMKVKNIESGLAWIGVLVVLAGVSFAAGTAFGSETAADDASIGDVAKVTVTGARNAIAQSATEAAEAIARDAARGLEIRLTGRTSTLVADPE